MIASLVKPKGLSYIFGFIRLQPEADQPLAEIKINPLFTVYPALY